MSPSFARQCRELASAYSNAPADALPKASERLAILIDALRQRFAGSQR